MPVSASAKAAGRSLKTDKTDGAGEVYSSAVSTAGAPDSAENQNPKEKIQILKSDGTPYTFSVLGDSISWGYGLDPNADNHDKFSVGTRVTGSFTDIIGSVLEQNNGAVVQPAASSGSRLCDYRILLERGMGVENPYDRANDWYGNRHPERTEVLRSMGPQIVSWVR